MSITASAVTPDKSLEEFRVEFNKLVQDFDGVSSGNTFTSTIIFEGATADAFETTFSVTDPTADNTIEFPNVGAVGTNPGGVTGNAKIITTMNASDPTTTTSSGDPDFVLVSDGGVLKKITASNLGIGGSAGSVAADDVQTGDAAVNITTSSGNITIDAAANDTDIIFKGTDNTADITMLTLDGSEDGLAIFKSGIKIADGGNIGSATDPDAIAIGSDGDVTLTQDLELQHDGAILSFGADDDVSLTHTNDVGITLNSTMKLMFNDASQYIQGASATVLDIAATDEIELTATLIDVVGNATVSGTLGVTGIATFTDDIIIGDGKTIGSATVVDAMTISAGGIVTFKDDIVLKDVCTIGTATTPAAVSIAADGTVNLATAGATVNSAVIKTAGLETVWVPASAMYPCTTNGCAALAQVETTAQQPELKVLDFDKDSDEFAQFTVAFPKSWNAGTITYRAYWVGLAATTGVAWTLAGRSVADNAEAVGAFGTAVVVQDDSQGDATEVLISATSGDVTIAGAADDTLTFFQISRDVSDGNDDMAGDARLAGIQIFYTTSAATDA
jgi:hypothetical protein